MKLFEDIFVLTQAFVFFVIIASCAQVGTPSGGVVDMEAPIVLEILPKPGATNVICDGGGTITVTFDEYVNVKSLNSQLLVSPLLPQGLQWSMKGKTVTFVWNDELQADKTYVFQFGDAVVDIREGNSLDNFVLAFSTGDHLDSLSISGSVVDVFTAEPKSGVRVLMYDAFISPDSIFKGAKPKFVGKTNESGEFLLNYLPSGRYKIIAIEDNDRNYIWTSGEGLAVFEEVVVVDGHVTLERPLRMQNTSELEIKYFVKSSRDSLGLVHVILSGPIELSDKIDVSGNRIFYDNENLWVLSGESSSDVVWCGNDTLNFQEIELIQMETFKEVKGPEGKVVSSNIAEFTFSRPLESVADSLFILITEDSLEMFLDSVYIDDLDPFKVVVEGGFTRGNSFELTVAPGGVVGYGGVQISDSTSFKWSVFEKKNLGNLSVKIAKEGWLELIASNGEVIQKQRLQNKVGVEFKNLTQGTYQLKWTGDMDGDGLWRSVDLLQWKSPDPAEIMSEKVKIKSDWSHEVVWLN
jgi:hypothetical protein